jgi:hypothetical protein
VTRRRRRHANRDDDIKHLSTLLRIQLAGHNRRLVAATSRLRIIADSYGLKTRAIHKQPLDQQVTWSSSYAAAIGNAFTFKVASLYATWNGLHGVWTNTRKHGGSLRVVHIHVSI